MIFTVASGYKFDISLLDPKTTENYEIKSKMDQGQTNQQLVDAVRDGRLDEVRTILRTYPNLDVNWHNENDSTTMQIAANQHCC